MDPIKINRPFPPTGAADTAAAGPGASATGLGTGEGFTVSHDASPRFAVASAALWHGSAASAAAHASDFRGAVLDRASFAGAALYGANFSEARLRDADFRGARLLAVRFDGADLSRADLRDLDTPWASFSGTVLAGANISFGPRALQRLGDMSFLSAVVQSTASIEDRYEDVRAPMIRQIVGELRSRTTPGSAALDAGVVQLLAGHPLFRDDPHVSDLLGRSRG